MKLRTWAGLVAAIGLSGCAPSLQGANEVGGMIHVGPSINNGAALKLADDHCRQYGKVARVSGENVWNSTMSFDCVAAQ